jgi:hypothetical protein
VALRLVPVTLAEAKRYIAEVHRHNDPPKTHRVSVGVADDDGKLRGVGVMGNPVARKQDDGRTAEVLRVATDGAPNACSMLYGAWALGYDRLITYTLETEGGASLKASGWTRDGITDYRPDHKWDAHPNVVRSWQRPTLFFAPKVPTGPKVRWVKHR